MNGNRTPKPSILATEASRLTRDLEAHTRAWEEHTEAGDEANAQVFAEQIERVSGRIARLVNTINKVTS